MIEEANIFEDISYRISINANLGVFMVEYWFNGDNELGFLRIDEKASLYDVKQINDQIVECILGFYKSSKQHLDRFIDNRIRFRERMYDCFGWCGYISFSELTDFVTCVGYEFEDHFRVKQLKQSGAYIVIPA